METANFDSTFDEPKFDPKHPTEYIKEKTRLYRQSWLIAPLERLMERYKSTV